MGLEHVMAFVLVLVRVASAMAFLPFLGTGVVPAAVKALTSVAIAMVITPMGGIEPPMTSWAPLQFALFAAAEVLFGALMGLSAQIVFKVLRNAGEMMGQQMGMALAHAADPVTGVDSTLIANFCDVVGVLVFFGLNGHYWLLSALHKSFLQWPLGAFLAPGFIRHIGVEAVACNMAMAFQAAAPLLLVAFTVSLLMAIVARLVPEINVLIVGFPLRIGVGLTGLILLMPVLAQHGAAVTGTIAELAGAVAKGS